MKLDSAILRAPRAPREDGPQAVPHTDTAAPGDDAPALSDAANDAPLTPPGALPADETDPLASARGVSGGAVTVADATVATTGSDDQPRDELGRLLDGNDLGRSSYTVDDTILRARCEDLARRILRDGGHTSHAALARELATTVPTLKRLMASPVYREVFDAAAEEVYGTIDDRLRDEKLDSLVRADTAQRRALTLLVETMEMTRAHYGQVADGLVKMVRPQIMRAGVDAAAEIRQVVSARSGATAGGASLNVTVNKVQATIIQGAVRESGVDLSDVIDAIVVGNGG